MPSFRLRRSADEAGVAERCSGLMRHCRHQFKIAHGEWCVVGLRAAGENADQHIFRDNRRIGAHLRFAEEAAFAFRHDLVGRVEFEVELRDASAVFGEVAVEQATFGRCCRLYHRRGAYCSSPADSLSALSLTRISAERRTRISVLIACGRRFDQRGQFDRAGNLLAVAAGDLGGAGQRAAQEQVNHRFGKLSQREIDACAAMNASTAKAECALKFQPCRDRQRGVNHQRGDEQQKECRAAPHPIRAECRLRGRTTGRRPLHRCRPARAAARSGRVPQCR